MVFWESKRHLKITKGTYGSAEWYHNDVKTYGNRPYLQNPPHSPMQGAKKIIFTACHSGKLKLAFTSPDVISSSPKSFLTSRVDFTVLLLFKFLKKPHLPVGQVKNRIH